MGHRRAQKINTMARSSLLLVAVSLGGSNLILDNAAVVEARAPSSTTHGSGGGGHRQKKHRRTQEGGQTSHHRNRRHRHGNHGRQGGGGHGRELKRFRESNPRSFAKVSTPSFTQRNDNSNGKIHPRQRQLNDEPQIDVFPEQEEPSIDVLPEEEAGSLQMSLPQEMMLLSENAFSMFVADERELMSMAEIEAAKVPQLISLDSTIVQSDYDWANDVAAENEVGLMATVTTAALAASTTTTVTTTAATDPAREIEEDEIDNEDFSWVNDVNITSAAFDIDDKEAASTITTTTADDEVEGDSGWPENSSNPDDTTYIPPLNPDDTTYIPPLSVHDFGWLESSSNPAETTYIPPMMENMMSMPGEEEALSMGMMSMMSLPALVQSEVLFPKSGKDTKSSKAPGSDTKSSKAPDAKSSKAPDAKSSKAPDSIASAAKSDKTDGAKASKLFKDPSAEPDDVESDVTDPTSSASDTYGWTLDDAEGRFDVDDSDENSTATTNDDIQVDTSPSKSPSELGSKAPTSKPGWFTSEVEDDTSFFGMLTTLEPSMLPSKGPSASPTSKPSQPLTHKPTTSEPTPSPTETPRVIDGSSSTTAAKPSESPVVDVPPRPIFDLLNDLLDLVNGGNNEDIEDSADVTPSPSQSPSASPTTTEPSVSPTLKLSASPTLKPSNSPTPEPSGSPSNGPTASPLDPTPSPTQTPRVVDGNGMVSNNSSPEPTRRPTRPPYSRPPYSRPPYRRPTKPPTREPIVTPGPSSAAEGESIIAPTTLEPTAEPTSKPTSASPTPKPSKSPSEKPSQSPTLKPSGSPTLEPSKIPTIQPSTSPTTLEPSQSPTLEPSASPTSKPSQAPTTMEPSNSPTLSPSKEPTLSPTTKPSVSIWPSPQPSLAPSMSLSPSTTHPTTSPTLSPSKSPVTPKPSASPTAEPSGNPSNGPSTSPTTMEPSVSPTLKPSASPTLKPSQSPTMEPSGSPTLKPSKTPSNGPTTSSPSNTPSVSPTTSSPSKSPSVSPTTLEPSKSPTDDPTPEPSTSPMVTPTFDLLYDLVNGDTDEPTKQPTSKPTKSPTRQPTSKPTRMPTAKPVTDSPTPLPTDSPTSQPTAKPTRWPTSKPTMKPTNEPTNEPSLTPTESPTQKPTDNPNMQPTGSPTSSPSTEPTSSPTMSPTLSPVTDSPTRQQTQSPSHSPSHQPTNSPSTSEPTQSPATSSPISSPTSSPTDTPTSATTTGAFSTDTSLMLDGISETMDDDTVSTLESVTQSFLNDQFSGSMEVDGVTVLGQSVVQSSEGRRLGRSLQSGDSLLIELGVEGTVSNWTALESSVEDSANDTTSASGGFSVMDSISTVISRSISSNYGEFTTQLADESDFFPFEGSEMYSSQAKTVDAESDGNSPSRLIAIVSGAAVALVVLIGSMFYMERRSGAKRRRSLNEDVSLEQSQYDLNDVTKSYEDEDGNVVNASSRNGSVSRHSKSRASRSGEDEADEGNNNGVMLECCGPPTSTKAGVKEARMTSLLDHADSAETEQVKEISALDMSPEQLKAAIKKKERNIFVFTDDKRSSSGNNDIEEGGDDDMLEIKHSVSSLSNPSQIEEPFSPSPRGGYLGDHFNYTNVEKMIGDQYDTRAIMTPFTPKGNGNSTPSRRTNYSFSSPVSQTRTRSSRKDKLFDVYAPPGPLGIIIDTTPEGPMIHSLKPTSQLLGLVNPGDLIVGLDGVDTRNMTAATFTRLMAKRSQGERKITLLKGLAPLTPTASTPR